MDFAVPADHRVKIRENEKRYKYSDLARQLKKTMEHDGDIDTNYDLSARKGSQRPGNVARIVGNGRMRAETI